MLPGAGIAGEAVDDDYTPAFSTAGKRVTHNGTTVDAPI
jgi:hypothetical protein